MSSTSERIRSLLRAVASALFTPGKTSSPPPRAQSHPQGRGAAVSTRKYPGDFTGKTSVVYAPKPDGAADPGEIVWTWVPYEEDYSQGKDRPVLLVGRHGKWLLALMLTSKDHTGDARNERDYLDIGTGSWDRQGRPSEVKMDRVICVDPAAMRREGAVLDAKRFAAVAAGLKRRYGWS